ncbi:hypothetical protein ACWOVX_004248 [Vibrio vulnificus]|nr:hypothetical protein [Vibrio vulnificus]
MDLYHRTSIYTAYKIINSQQIWSNDGYEQANFHTEKFGGGSDCEDEITLHFKWSGGSPIELPNKWVGNIPSHVPVPKKWPGLPNTLYKAYMSGKSKLWALVLFPGTVQNLAIVDCSDVTIKSERELKYKEYIFKEILNSLSNSPIPVSVPEPKNRRNIHLPKLP